MTASAVAAPALCLASASPRRRELLAQIGVPHRVLPVQVDETPLPEEAPAGYVRRLARAKAAAGHRLQAGCLVLGADTAVVIDGQILGKPQSWQEALEMLTRLSGRSHQVFSAVALMRADGRLDDALSTSVVRMRRIEPGEALAYWHTGEPADKAGAYGIQGLGAMFVACLEGSYSGVMGLPLYETAILLQDAGLVLLESA